MSTEARTHEEIGGILARIAEMTNTERASIRVTLRTANPRWVLWDCSVNWAYVHDTNLCHQDKIRVSVTDRDGETYILTWNRSEDFNWGGEVIIDRIAVTNVRSPVTV